MPSRQQDAIKKRRRIRSLNHDEFSPAWQCHAMQRAKSGIAGLGDRLRRSRSNAIASPGVAGFCCFSASPDAGWLFAVLGTPHVWAKNERLHTDRWKQNAKTELLMADTLASVFYQQ